MSEMQTVPNAPIHWFEIPCSDLDRAATFYETLLETKLQRSTMNGPMAIFPHGDAGPGGTPVGLSPQGTSARRRAVARARSRASALTVVSRYRETFQESLFKSSSHSSGDGIRRFPLGMTNKEENEAAGIVPPHGNG